MSKSTVLSPSSRRAWIEIPASGRGRTWAGVALLAEGVDRNFDQIIYNVDGEVALLAEGVDRNYTSAMETTALITSPSSRRAWIEIYLFNAKQPANKGSPSSRRAWIEIFKKDATLAVTASPTSRRAVIEIYHRFWPALLDRAVALHAEGVDRNPLSLIF